MYQILPSILSADMLSLADDIQKVLLAGADMLHLDVMDNHYVPNLTIGPHICEQLHQRFPNVPLDVHLMIKPVDNMIASFAKAGASRISIHPDATTHLDRSLQLIQSHGCQVGLALNPATSLDCLTWCAHRLDFVLVMTVNPGFGGQSLISQMIDKILSIHEQYPALPISVDGGVNLDNILQLAHAGATQFVAGSAIFNSKSYEKTIASFRKRLI